MALYFLRCLLVMFLKKSFTTLDMPWLSTEFLLAIIRFIWEP